MKASGRMKMLDHWFPSSFSGQ